MSPASRKKSRWMTAAAAAIATTALIAAACGGGTSSADKTATKAAGGATPAVTSGATKAAGATAAATSGATKAATTPAAGATTAATKAATTPAAGATTAAAGGVKVGTTSLGSVLTDGAGLTLYTFDKDVVGDGKSAAEALTAVWPPLSLAAAPSNVTGATGAWAMFKRVDGKTQISYKGMPLYYFVNDKAPGDILGDGVGGVWHVAKP